MLCTGLDIQDEDTVGTDVLTQARLRELGSHYGALPAHAGLWESAAATAHSLPARLAIESCVHEARGLDMLPQTIGRCAHKICPETRIHVSVTNYS